MSMENSLMIFDEDFHCLMGCKQYLLSKLEQLEKGQEWSAVLKSGIFDTLPNGRKIRFCLPRSREETLTIVQQLESINIDRELTFVGFIGYAKPKETISKETLEHLWDADQRLIDEFQNQKYLLAYVSAEREIGGNWVNLVLCSKLQGITDWQNFTLHNQIATEVSPNYYTHIRIHRGSLPNGLYSQQFQVDQTLFLSFPGNNQQNIRYRQIWKRLESSSYFTTGNTDPKTE